MKFYDATNKDGICQEIDRWCDSTDTEYPRLDKTARVNRAQELVGSWIMEADGYWQFDDSNQTNLPIGTGTLTSGQLSYTFADELLDIEEIDILNLDGIYVRITPFDPDQMGMSFEEWRNHTTSTTQEGFPTYYDKQGDSIRFDVAPTAAYCTLTNGLKVRFKRTTKDFTAVSTTATDTTAPGFASPFHIILAYMAALPYCVAYKPDRADDLRNLIGDGPREASGMKRDLQQFYSRREKDRRHIMTPKRTMWGTSTIGL